MELEIVEKPNGLWLQQNVDIDIALTKEELMAYAKGYLLFENKYYISINAYIKYNYETIEYKLSVI